MAEELKFSWLKNISKGIMPVLVTAGVSIAIQLLDLFQAEVDAGGLKLGFLTGIIIGLINMAKNFLKNK